MISVGNFKMTDEFSGELSQNKLFIGDEVPKAGRILNELGGMTIYEARQLLKKCEIALEQVKLPRDQR